MLYRICSGDYSDYSVIQYICLRRISATTLQISDFLSTGLLGHTLQQIQQVLVLPQMSRSIGKVTVVGSPSAVKWHATHSSFRVVLHPLQGNAHQKLYVSIWN